MILPGVPDHSRPYAPSPVKSVSSARSTISSSAGGGGKDTGGKKSKGKQAKNTAKPTKHPEGDVLVFILHVDFGLIARFMLHLTCTFVVVLHKCNACSVFTSDTCFHFTCVGKHGSLSIQ